MEGYMVQAMVVCVFIFILFFWSWRLKAKYQRQAIDHVLGEFVTIEGTSYTRLLRVDEGLVEIPPDERKEIAGKTFPVSEKSTFLADYPEGHWCPRFLKCKIKKVVFREFDLEPISNIYERQFEMSPVILHNIRREKVTEIGAKITEARGKELGIETKKKTKFSGSTWLLLLMGLVIVILIVVVFNYSGQISEMKAVLGW
jgi:hypothetical protein